MVDRSPYGWWPSFVKRRALITGITGQDGSYLAELLLQKGYAVHGLVSSEAIGGSEKLSRIQRVLDQVRLYPMDIRDASSVLSCVKEIRPDECYHLAATSYLGSEFHAESDLLRVNFCATHSLLAAIRHTAPNCRFFSAGSSEVFGDALESPQSEDTPFRPRSSYAVAKVASFFVTRSEREVHGTHASTGILFNHESPRRDLRYVSRRITSGVARIKGGLANELFLGDLDARRDWGHSKDFVKAMWLMLQAEESSDYVIATGVSRSVRDFASTAFACADLDYRDFVKVDPTLTRSPESFCRVGCIEKARRDLRWHCNISFEEMVREMVEYDLSNLAACAR